MDFGILGPLQVLDDGTPLPLGGPRQRAVLARLLLDAGRAVPVDVLVDDVWAGNPPPTAAKTLQKYVSELRKALGAPVVRTTATGYAVDLDAAGGCLDARRFEELVASGDVGAALDLWRGDVLADLPDLDAAAPERTRLRELRLVAVERRLEAELDAGRHAEVAADLAELAEQHPLRERLCGLLLLALYRSGRQVEALRAFERHRQRLADDVGVDPAPELRALEAAILRHDPALDLPATPAPASAPPGNLQPSLSSFVGRDRELTHLLDALESSRLVTLVGPGGVGKTRLAIEAASAGAARYPGGAWFVELAAVSEPDLIAHTIAITLAIADQQGQDNEQTVLAALRHRTGLLLVVDNCEHLVDGCARLLDRIVRTCPGASVLATSRRPLGIDGEHVLPVNPLDEAEAVRLFADRARLSGGGDVHDEAPLAGICRSLDGLPLAIELVAGQVRVLGTPALADRLDDRLQFVGRRFDAGTRHRTLHDTVAWSHELLPTSARRVFAHLSVFASTAPLDAASKVCGGDVLADVTTLVDHSLLAREPVPTTPPRYRLLETLRLFALEQLTAAGEEQAARRAHTGFYEALGREAGPQLYGPSEHEWVQRLEIEEPNLHAALTWAREHDVTEALRLGIALWEYWDLRWRERFAIAFFQSVLADPRLDAPPDLRAWGTAALADLAANPGEARRASGWAEDAVAAFRALDDDAGLAASLFALGSAYGNGGRLDEAEAALHEAMAIAERTGDAKVQARGLNHLSFVAARRGDHALAATISERERDCWVAVGSRRGEATGLRHLAVAYRYHGELDRARRLCDRALELWIELDDAASAAHVRSTMADIARDQGDASSAVALYDQVLDEFRSIGDRRCTASTFKNLGSIALDSGDLAASSRLYIDAVRLRHELGDHAGLAECLEGLGRSLAAGGRHDEAVLLLGAADNRRRASGAIATPAEAAATTAVLTAARESMPQRRYEAALARGRDLSPDDVVDTALSFWGWQPVT